MEPSNIEQKCIKDVIDNESGQSIIEFILLLLVMILISFSVLKGFNAAVKARWVDMIATISSPNSTTITFP